MKKQFDDVIATAITQVDEGSISNLMRSLALAGGIGMSTVDADAKSIPRAPSAAIKQDAKTHRVMPGDTLSKIAKQYNVPAAEVIKLNNIKNPNQIRAGIVLKIPPATTPKIPGVAPAPIPAPSPAPNIQKPVSKMPPLQYTLPRNLGGRNNNPGNIRYSKRVKWDGQIGSEGGFVKFSNPEFGVRALFRLLNNYHKKYGLTTVREVVTKYAPPNENATAKYIQFVADQMGIKPDDKIDFKDTAQVTKLVKAVIKKEIGYTAPPILLQRGLQRSLNETVEVVESAAAFYAQAIKDKTTKRKKGKYRGQMTGSTSKDLKMPGQTVYKQPSKLGAPSASTYMVKG